MYVCMYIYIYIYTDNMFSKWSAKGSETGYVHAYCSL